MICKKYLNSFILPFHSYIYVKNIHVKRNIYNLYLDVLLLEGTRLGELATLNRLLCHWS